MELSEVMGVPHTDHPLRDGISMNFHEINQRAAASPMTSWKLPSYKSWETWIRLKMGSGMSPKLACSNKEHDTHSMELGLPIFRYPLVSLHSI